MKLTDLKGTAATIDVYDNVLDAVPEPLSTIYISATERFRLGYGSDIEAEGAKSKAKNIVMGMPKVKVITQRVRDSVHESPAVATPQKSTGGTEARSPPTTEPKQLFATPPHATHAEQHVPSSSLAPWTHDLAALESRVNTSISEVKSEQAQLKATLDGVRDTQKKDSSMLGLMSIRMTLAEPDPNNFIEMKAARMARGDSGIAGPTPQAPPEVTVVDDDMDRSEDRKCKVRQSQPTVDTRWIILGLGEPPQHLDTWAQFRTIIKEQRDDGIRVLPLVNPQNTTIGNPFTATKPAPYKTQEEADAALSARLAGLRDC